MRLIYTVTDRQTEQKTDYDYRVWMHTTPVLGVAVRWWFSCPQCGRRCGTLYLPPGAQRFACRRCHNLTYASCQDERKRGYLDRLIPGLAELDAWMKYEKTGRMSKTLKAIVMQEQQARLQKALDALAHMPQPYANYLTAAELCERSGLTAADLAGLEAARLLLPDQPSGKYRPKLVSWAGKLAYLLRAGWAIPEIRSWAKGRWSTPNPRAWPPAREAWQQCGICTRSILT